MAIKTIEWKNGAVRLIDQRLLPGQLKYIVCRDVKTLWQAIRVLAVRGAPALGIAAGFAVLLGIQKFKGNDPRKFKIFLQELCAYIGTSRPTAVNLFNVLERLQRVVVGHPDFSVAQLKALLTREALEVFEEDRKVCRQMGSNGAKLIPAGRNIMTVCNAGALATADYGTALGVMYSAKAQGKKFQVFACETRPLLQGARLTAWELVREKIPVTLICDNMAASVMRHKNIAAIFAGADRIASNGDTANKIGTYSLAVLAKHHGIPLYIVAPLSTFDLKIRSGRQIPIEERKPEEVTHFAGRPTAPSSVTVFNPAFDVTDHSLISGIVTERGIIRPPFMKNIRAITQDIIV